MTSRYWEHLASEADEIRDAGLFKFERIIASQQDAVITLEDGSEVINFCANNYLGLANDPALVSAATTALEEYGYGMASVRFICGTQTVHKELEQQIGKVEREFSDLDEVWKTEKAALHGSQQVKEKLDQARQDMEVARRESNLGRMSELQYGVVPELEKQLDMASQAEMTESPNTLLRNKVSEEEVADVVSKWTGIPVSKMLEGEREKLLRMEQELHQSVIGQHEAVVAVSHAVRRSRAGLADPNRPNIYVKYDYMARTTAGGLGCFDALPQVPHSHEPSETALELVRNAFLAKDVILTLHPTVVEIDEDLDGPGPGTADSGSSVAPA